MLLNRQRELTYLNSRYARRGADLAVLYGRRRVGKTTLVYEWCQDKPHLYSERRVVFGEARWRSTNVTLRDLGALAEKGLLWLRGDTSRWEVHYAFFARNFGQVEAVIAEESVHLFSPADVIGA